LKKSIAQRKAENPRVIHEFEGGPIGLFWKNELLFGSKYQDDSMKPVVLYACKDHPIFQELKITPTLDAVVWEKVELVTECEECDECSPETCPKQIEEVGEKGSGMKLSETLEGWTVDLAKCTPWKVCGCCKGTGYVNVSAPSAQNEKVLEFLKEHYLPSGEITAEVFSSIPGAYIVRDKSGDEMLLWWSGEYECFMWANLEEKVILNMQSGGST